MRTIITAASLFVAVVFGFGVSSADAHAFLDHSDPRVGGSVSSAPRQITLWFTQNLEPAFSTAIVNDANGARVNEGKARVNAGSPNVLQVSLKHLSPGTYRVFWRVLSVDTHTTEGSFSFRVGSQ